MDISPPQIITLVFFDGVIERIVETRFTFNTFTHTIFGYCFINCWTIVFL